ncbi:MAG TPA: carboxypeptidase regulatory-like domain-containing protein [Candidatus Acidoferrales bacterium]|nr:carboxypeptidase regulatory-like domain-containing protein [Candidatus Acidoferrales bacterium]
MKGTGKSNLLIVLMIACLVAGCKRPDNAVGPTTGTTGSLVGNIDLMQQDRTFAGNGEGVQVSIQGTSLSTTTDTSGYFKFSDLKAGTYRIIFHKSGFGTAELESYQFVPNDTFSPVVFQILFQIPSYYASALRVVVLDSTVTIHGCLSDSGSYQKLALIFVGMDSTIADYNHSAFYIFAQIPSDSSQFYGSIATQTFHNFGLQSGSVAYLAARTYVGLATYTDSTGKEIYTSFNPNVTRASIVVP